VPDFFSWILSPLLAGLLLTTLIDAASGGPVLRSPPRRWLVHAGLLTVAFCAELLVFRRPWFAASQMLVLQGVVLSVSAVKKKALQEPFVFQDVEYFVDMLRHPRLYLPFFGFFKLALILGGVAAMIGLSMQVEASLLDRIGTAAFAEGWLLLSGGAAALLWLSTRRPFAASFDAQADRHRFGLSASLAAYAIAEKQALDLPDRFATMAASGPVAALPNIVVVQSESFFDARRLWPGVHAEVYAAFDEARARSLRHGLLEVPAIGANTVRTEFAFLSGLRENTLGVHRFNPYRRLPWRGVRTLAHRLRDAGYRTVCIHPYEAAFYRRDQVFPRFGFDEFIDVRAFGAGDRAGPFVGDVAVAARVNDMLAQPTQQPLFVFVITMENHGPLHLERLEADEIGGLFREAPPAGFEDLGVYLRHIRNAGRMMSTLRDGLSAQSRPGVLGWYGDHVPILPAVYARTGFSDARTDYFIWGSPAPAHAPTRSDANAADLAEAVLQAADLTAAGNRRPFP
jgi:sulfatase-like protein